MGAKCIKSIAECSLGAFCNTFDLHYAMSFLSGLLSFTASNLRILVKKNKFPTDQPILVKQGRVRGNKNIFKVGFIL